MTILIIDDSRIIRERIVSRLQELNTISRILEAENASEAKKVIAKDAPDKVILDLRLPDTNGIDLLKWIKEYQPGIDVMVLTNYPYPEYERKCLQYGASHFLDKGSEMDKIINLLSEVKPEGIL